MFLKSIFMELDKSQLWFKWKNTIDQLLSIDLSKKEWRFKFILDVLQYWKSLWFTIFIESNKLFDNVLLKRALIQCKTYSNNPTIVKWKLLTVIQDLSFEFIKDKREYDYSLIQDIINWKADISDFILNEWDESEANTIYSFQWKSWKVYSGKWRFSLNELKEADLLDIISWYNTDEELINNAKDYLLNTPKKEINKNFKSLRVAALSLVMDLTKKSLDENKWKLLTFISENK